MLYDGIIMIIAIEMFCSLGFIKAIAVSYEEGLSLKDCGYFKSENKRKRRIGMFLVLITIIAWFLGLQFSEYIAVELVCFLLFVGGAVSSINLLISGTRLDKNLQ